MLCSEGRMLEVEVVLVGAQKIHNFLFFGVEAAQNIAQPSEISLAEGSRLFHE